MPTTLEPLVSLRRHAAAAPWTLAEVAALADRLLGGADHGSERPISERTVRFYVARGVVAPPFGRGPGSAWGYPHLVELLAVRICRRAGESLEAIAGRRDGLTLEALERLVADGLGVVAAPAEPSPRAATLPAPDRCITVAPGVELHVAGDHPLAADPERLDALVDRLARDVVPRTQEIR
jgi:hypothetical protein